MFRKFTIVFRTASIWLTLVLAAFSAARAQEGGRVCKPEEVDVRTELVEVEPGVRLATRVFMPRGEGRFPAIVVRTPYVTAWPGPEDQQFPRQFAALGYVCVAQQCRGTSHSEGEWRPYIHEREDGIKLQKWVVEQKWCNGKIATWGASYLGYTQWASAPEEGDALKAMLTFVPTFNWYETCYASGAFRLRMNMLWGAVMGRPRADQASLVVFDPKTEIPKPRNVDWSDLHRHLPLRTWDERLGVGIPWVRDALAHPDCGDYWAPSSASAHLQKVAVPTLTITGWYDIFLDQALHYVPELRKCAKTEMARRHQYLEVGPWGHGLGEPVGELDFGKDTRIDLTKRSDEWYRHWLKGEDTGIDERQFLRIFVMGANVWRYENEWPLQRTRYAEHYFHGGGCANTLDGDGRLSTEQPDAEKADHYVYNPEDPVPTHGGESNFLGPCGPLDQREIEKRSDVLVYTSDELTDSLEVTGPVKVVLYAASNARDTDWTGKLVDVHPDGRAFNLCDGIIRARYRKSLTNSKLLTSNEVYRYEIDLWATSNVFLPGHRIRVEISSSNFPRFDRNPNTGHQFGAELVVANQTVYHDKQHPSHILLPVIPPVDDD